MSLSAASRRMADRLLTTCFTPRLFDPTDVERVACEELVEYFRGAELSGDTASPEWAEFMSKLQKHVLNDDPRRFIQWPVIYSTMACRFSRSIRPELNKLKQQPDFESHWKPALKEDPIGNGVRYPAYPQSSGTRIHHAYHLLSHYQSSGIRPESRDCIVEFGGGYGDMCRLVHNLGFLGKYIIFDLEPFSALQQYYLKSLELPVRPFCDYDDYNAGIFCVSDNELITQTLQDTEAQSRLFIATWSLSETPLEARSEWGSWIHKCDQYLIAFQDKFGGQDNHKYFGQFSDQRPEISWETTPIAHMPTNSYLLGHTN